MASKQQFIPVLATTFAAFYLGALAVRPDMTFGMVYGGFLLLFAVMLRRDPKQKATLYFAPCSRNGSNCTSVSLVWLFGSTLFAGACLYRWAVHGGALCWHSGAMLVGWALAMALWYSFFRIRFAAFCLSFW